MITNFILFMASKFNKIGLFQGLGITVEKNLPEVRRTYVQGTGSTTPKRFS